MLRGVFSAEWLSRSSQKPNHSDGEVSQQDAGSQSNSGPTSPGNKSLREEHSTIRRVTTRENVNPQTNGTEATVNSTHHRDLVETQQTSYQTILADAIGEMKDSNDMKETLFGAKDWTDRRRPRTIFSGQQLSILESSFQHQQYPGTCQRHRLAGDLSLSETQVRTWFQNRRMKLKQQLQDAQAEARKSRMIHQYLSCQLQASLGFFPPSDTKFFPVFGPPHAPTSISDYCTLHLGNPLANYHQNPIQTKTAPGRYHPYLTI